MTLGRYVNNDTYIHRLDPRNKFIMLFKITISPLDKVLSILGPSTLTGSNINTLIRTTNTIINK